MESQRLVNRKLQGAEIIPGLHGKRCEVCLLE